MHWKFALRSEALSRAKLSRRIPEDTLSRAMLSREHTIPAHYPRSAPEGLSRAHAIPTHTIRGADAIRGGFSGARYPGSRYPGNTLSGAVPEEGLSRAHAIPAHTIRGAHAIRVAYLGHTIPAGIKSRDKWLVLFLLVQIFLQIRCRIFCS